MRTQMIDGRLVLAIDDVIGGGWLGGVNARDVREALDGAGAGVPVTVRLDSPGGDSREGIAIHNLLRRHQGRVRVEVESLAYSAASVIAMAADERLMAPNAMLMIHRAWTMTVGDADDHGRAIAMLERDDATYAATYAERSGLSRSEVLAAMSAETYYTASEAISLGLMTGLVDLDGAEDDAPESPEDAADAAVLRFPAAAAWCRRAAASATIADLFSAQRLARKGVAVTGKIDLDGTGDRVEDSGTRASGKEATMPATETQAAQAQDEEEPPFVEDEEDEEDEGGSRSSLAKIAVALGLSEDADEDEVIRTARERSAGALALGAPAKPEPSAEILDLRRQIARAQVEATSRVMETRGIPLSKDVETQALALFDAGHADAARFMLDREEQHAAKVAGVAGARALASPAEKQRRQADAAGEDVLRRAFGREPKMTVDETGRPVRRPTATKE